MKYGILWFRIVAVAMIPLFIRFLILFFLLVHTGNCATYTRPDGSKEIFKLEKIPLQVNSMKGIAKQLLIITRREQDADNAMQQRANAQLLALAMRLDLGNKEARKIDQLLSKGKTLDSASDGEVVKAKSKLRFYKKWLSSADAGADANLLAGYLTDATKILNPNTAENADTANWSGIVPPLSKTPTPDEIKPDTGDTPKEAGKTDTDDSPPPPAAGGGETKFHLTELKLKAPFKTDESKKYTDPKDNEEKHRTITRFEITPIKIKLSTHTKEKKFTIAFSPSLPWLKEEYQRTKAVTKLTSPVITLLKSRHKNLPVNHATVSIGLGKYSKFNRQSVTAPMAVMLEASLLNKPLRDDIYVCASIDSKGNIIQPINFWPLLDILRKSDSTGRLIVPKHCSEVVTGLLIHGEADFFTRWEVITATNLDEALNAAIQKSSPELAEASELFATIQKLTQKTDTSKLVMNKAVKKRLAEIRSLAPNHLSASALLLQGSGKRPSSLSEKSLAYELLPILQSMNKTLSSGMATKLPKANELKKIHAQYRADLLVIERLVSRSHDELYKGTLNLANDFRRLATLARRIASGDSTETAPLTKSATSTVSTMQRECDALIEKSDQLINPGAKNQP